MTDAMAVTVDQPIPVPSGQEVRLIEVIWNAPGPEGLTWRFRFLAPRIGQDVDYDLALGDMDYLCQTYVVPRLTATGPQPAQVVVSLSDRPLPFGQTDPEAVQFFEAYRIAEGRCIWEQF